MVTNEDTITTAHPSKKKGISIPAKLYEALSHFILYNIVSRQDVTSMDLLVDAEAKFPGLPNLTWYIIHVKLDLEARGFIQLTERSSHKPKFLKITSPGIKHLNLGSRHQ